MALRGKVDVPGCKGADLRGAPIQGLTGLQQHHDPVCQFATVAAAVSVMRGRGLDAPNPGQCLAWLALLLPHTSTACPMCIRGKHDATTRMLTLG